MENKKFFDERVENEKIAETLEEGKNEPYVEIEPEEINVPKINQEPELI